MIGVPRIMALLGPEDILGQVAECGLVGDDDVAVDVGFGPAGKGEDAFAGGHVQFDGHFEGVVPNVVEHERHHGIAAEGDAHGKGGDAPVPGVAIGGEDGWPADQGVEQRQHGERPGNLGESDAHGEGQKRSGGNQEAGPGIEVGREREDQGGEQQTAAGLQA